MIFGAIAATTAVVAAVALSRRVSRSRASKYAARELARAVSPDGIVAGAESVAIGEASPRGALLLHGFNDTPQSLARLAHALGARGWMVRAPLLPAHGRGAEVFLRDGNADAWIESARAAWAELRASTQSPVLVGQSMGGAIAVILAVEAEPSALVLIAPYLYMGTLPRLLAPVWTLWQLFVPELRSDPVRAIQDPVAREASCGGTRFSPRLVWQLLRVVKRARGKAGSVSAPTFVVHSRADYRIPADAAEAMFQSLGAREKVLAWSKGGHVITSDVGSEEVIRDVVGWLDGRVPAPGSVAPPGSHSPRDTVSPPERISPPGNRFESTKEY